MIIFSLVWLLTTGLAISTAEKKCEKMWDADINDPTVEICDVLTTSGEKCVFPLVHEGVTYNHCILGQIQDDFPACKTGAGVWAQCAVPTNAIINGVTTRKSEEFSVRGASNQGGALVMISGKRFADAPFSTSPSASATNVVYLTNQFSSYECEIHPDATTNTQLTCYTPKMLDGDYLIRVQVKGDFIPMYQYKNKDQSSIMVSASNTPVISKIEPINGVPGTFVDITGDFKTECYMRDTEKCADDHGARITRVYFGGQQCVLVNSTSSEVFVPVTATAMKCRLDKPEVGYFLASMLVTNEFGRSKIDKSIVYVSPDQQLYNFQTFAEIDSISPQVGSTQGGTRITITGKYLYTDKNVPATIDIAGEPCKVIDFDMSDQKATRIVCESGPSQQAQADNYGGRGVTLITDSVLTSEQNLATAVPSGNANERVLNAAKVSNEGNSSVTVWMKGFLYPRINSSYEFTATTNGQYKLFISTDSQSAGKTEVSDGQALELVANTYYFFLAVGSKSGGGLNLEVNAKMLTTSLTDEKSNFVQNEIQEVEISSTVVHEKYEISAISNSSNSSLESTGAAQTLVVKASNGEPPFKLRLYDVDTVTIAFGAAAAIVQTALNDMPFLYPNLATVTDASDSDGVSKIYTITFSANLGAVPLLTETLGLVNITASELNGATGGGSKSHLMIENVPSPLFDLNSEEKDIKEAIDQSFGIRCPNSIQQQDDTQSFATFDFEDCAWGENIVSETAFCGKCASQSRFFFRGLNVPLTYEHLCMAYRVKKSSAYIWIKMVDPLLKTLKNTVFKADIIGDDKWHYTCWNIKEKWVAANPTSRYNPSIMQVESAGVWPFYGGYFDVISVRNTLPLGYEDVSNNITSRTVFPKLQIQTGSSSVVKTDDKVTFSFRPTNCSSNLSPISLVNSFNASADNTEPIINKLTSASSKVSGTFNLAWAGHNLNNIPADISDSDLSGLLQTIPSFGNALVTRSKDCAGYKWSVKWLNGGDQAMISIPASSLSGNSPSIAANKKQDGGVLFSPINDDLLRTYHNTSQVAVMINSVPTKCKDCSFVWSADVTPVVNSVDASSTSAIVIGGSGFSANAADNVVTIEGIKCTITASSTTELTCAAGHNSIGTYPIKVNVLGKGLAQMNGNNMVASFSLVASVVSPSSGSTGGGNELHINGTGFSNKTTVTLDGQSCRVVSASYFTITCIVPASSTTTNKQVDVLVTESGFTSTVSSAYLYNADSTPVISTVTPHVLSVMGGQTIVAAGSNLPTVSSGVKFGDRAVSIVSSNSTHLVLRSPPMTAGVYDLNLVVEGLGMARVNEKIEYRFFVQSFSPNIGSIRGGTNVVVNGGGFDAANCHNNVVSFDSQVCQIKNCTSDYITCQTSSAYITHQVTNDGSDPYNGKGYAWTKPHLTINIGDSVRWSWAPPTGITTVKYIVSQVADAMSTEPSGFASGEPQATGSFTHQFNQAGVYHYWSGKVESSGIIKFRGIVEVIDSVDKSLVLSVKLNGFEAQKCSFPFTYNSNEYTTCTNVDSNSNWCSPTPVYDGQKIPCDASSSPQTAQCDGSAIVANTCGVTAPTDRYTMLFTSCSNNLPTLSYVSHSNATYNTQITLTGTNFATTQCENKVLIGKFECTIISASSTELVCEIGRNSGLYPNYAYKIEVLVANKGYALQSSSFELKFVSKVDQISTNIGSVAGGTTILIHGDGFLPSSTIVFIGNTPYYNNNNAQITSSLIEVTTLPGNGGEQTTQTFDMRVSVNNVNAECTGNCNFEISDTVSPVLSSCSPMLVNDSSEITLAGQNFGSNQSAVIVRIGNEVCSVNSFSATEIKCQVAGVVTGQQLVNVKILGVGNAKSSQTHYVTGKLAIKSITPNSGSVNGGQQVEIRGNGFTMSTNISIGIYPCIIKTASVNLITCLTSTTTNSNRRRRSVSNVNQLINLISNGEQVSSSNVFYSYSDSATPSVSSVSPTSGLGGDITLTGTGFGTDANNVRVTVGAAGCVIKTVTDTQIVCELSASSAGSFSVVVNRLDVGNSNNNIKYEYSLAVSSLSHTEGSIGGGLSLVLSGSGFSMSTVVTICNNPCKVKAVTFTSLTCVLPAANVKDADSSCDINVAENGLSASSSFNYRLALTPSLTSVSPLRGGTGGGTLLTIIGSGFPTDDSLVNVTIAGAPCLITAISATQINCRTEPYRFSSIIATVDVAIASSGLALNDGSVKFEYIDLWSSKFTWGGLPPPGHGEIAVIAPGQHIYFDAAFTPVLKGIIIQGGSLIFDDNQDVSLNVEYVLIIGNGKFQVGTAEKPFKHKAVITMFGAPKSIELPTYGAKVIAVRNGTLDIHGMPVGVTWTRLGSTAEANATNIVLQEPVVWGVGSEIIIATTGDRLSPGESELHFISAKSSDNRTLTLQSKLKYKHLGEDRTVGSGGDTFTVSPRAEVGLMTRNVLFQGNKDDSWDRLKTAEPCPTGFSPAEFAAQTCFLGRYGPELGSNEFGGIIFIHAGLNQPKDVETVIARLSNVELYHVGQSFKKGRYPIHFHINGDMPSSFVKECAIHDSFNRAINIHASNYLTLSRNVIYNIMGGAFFLEDGVEIGNEFTYNLAIFVKTTSSLLNEDVTPASYWVTNANNTYLHNVAAGATHFGWWYRILDHPEGPSFREDYCPKHIPFGRHFNNTAHSIGRFGIWVFPGYMPSISGACDDKRPSVAKFEHFTTYGNDKGAEFVNSNNIQFNNFIVYDQHNTGLDIKLVKGSNIIDTYQKEALIDDNLRPMISESVIIGNSKQDAKVSLAHRGLTWPWDRGFKVKNVKFYNFPGATAMDCTEVDGTCSEECGGWINHVSGLSFNNVQYRHSLRWHGDNNIIDLDGSLTGKANDYVVYKDAHYASDSRCRTSPSFNNSLLCSNVNTQIRYAFNEYQPVAAVLMNATNKDGKTIQFGFSKTRLTHAYGFMTTLEAKNEFSLYFANAPTPTNMSYNGAIYNFFPGDWIIVSHPLTKKPDVVKTIPGRTISESNLPLDHTKNNAGDWYWDEATSAVKVIFKNEGVQPFQDFEFDFDAMSCRFVGCKPPESPADRPPIAKRPDNAIFWSNSSSWGRSNFLSRRRRSLESGKPDDGDSILIPDGVFMVVDAPLPKLKLLKIEGYLELDGGIDHDLEVEMIFISGGQLIIGWENQPILTNVNINLVGEKNSLNYQLPNGMESIGGKGMGVYGGLDIHGKPRTVSWTTLAATARPGDTEIRVVDTVESDWVVGDEVLITTTSFILEHTEIRRITAVSGQSITLDEALVFDHLAQSETFADGTGYNVAAAVGLLTRNVKIIAKEYATQEADLYGSRIIVGDFSAIINDYVAYFKGFARISNAEFVRPGQFSRDAGDDSKYGILFTNLGTYNETRPNYVKSSSFHRCMGTAIGIFSSSGMRIEDNVIHRTIEYGIRFKGSANIARRNLLAVNYWGSTFNIPEAVYDTKNYWGAVDISYADSAIIEDNFIAGSERIGLNTKGDTCEGETLPGDLAHSIHGNRIHGCGIGYSISSKYAYESQSCLRVKGNTIFRSRYYGVYYQGAAELVVENNVLVDNQIGVFTIIHGFSPMEHGVTDRQIINRDMVIVGRSKLDVCDQIVYPYNTSDGANGVINKFYSFGAGPWNKGRIGLVLPNFVMQPNGAPFKPWSVANSYNQIGGKMTVSNITFANFNATSCRNQRDTAFSTNTLNDDCMHPVSIDNMKLYKVDKGSKVFLHWPGDAQINPSDCIDMHCDGKKKVLLTDKDGSFLGQPGAIISKAEHRWGEQSAGIGDFRIPKDMLAYANGSMISPSDLYKYPGIIRDPNTCTYNDDWHAYECYGLEYKMLMIESMDHDTEDRRLSPVAILSDNKYLDLINGPADHGWCFGYTCQKRVSLFMALVAANHSYDIVISSTPPEVLRMRIINADANFKIRLSMHYTNPQRIDLYNNGEYKAASNAVYDSKGDMKLSGTEPREKYMPTYKNASGTNLFIKEDLKIYFAADGASYYDLKIAPVLFISFGLPAMTPEEFFNEATIVGNFAKLLGVDASKIRRVEIVRASRRRRDTNSLNFIKITIEENANTNLNDAAADKAQKESFNKLDAKIGNLFVTNQLQENAKAMLNVTISSLSVQKPSGGKAKAVPSKALIVVETEASGCSAQTPCTTQPKIKIVDENGDLVDSIGNEDFPWIIVASLTSSSNPSAKLIMETEAKVVEGYAQFKKLAISDASTFSVSFKFKTPEGVNDSKFDPGEKGTPALSAALPELSCQQYEDDITVATNTNFNMTVKIVDKNSKTQLENISWANYQWTAEIKLHELGYHKASGRLNTVNSNVIFDPVSGLASFTDLAITATGMYLLTFTVKTSNNEYNFNCFSKAITVSTAVVSYDANSAPNYVFKYDGDYNLIEPDEVKANVYNFISGYNISLGGIQVVSGSVYISFYSSDSSSSLINTLVASGLTVDPNLQFSYVSINDNIMNCTNCVVATTTEAPEKKKDVAVGAIVGGVMGGLVAACILVGAFFLFQKYKKLQMQQTKISNADAQLKSPRPAFGDPNESRISKLMEMMKLKTSPMNQYQKARSTLSNTNTPVPQLDISDVNGPSDQPMPVLPRAQTEGDYKAPLSAHSRKFENFV